MKKILTVTLIVIVSILLLAEVYKNLENHAYSKKLNIELEKLQSNTPDVINFKNSNYGLMSFYFFRSINDNALVILEKGQEKRSFKVNQFCKKVHTHPLVEKYGDMWLSLHSTFKLDPRNQVEIHTNCDKTYTLDLTTGNLSLIPAKEPASLGVNTIIVLKSFSVMLITTLIALFSTRLQNQLTRLIATAHYLILIYASAFFFLYMHAAFDESIVKFFN